METPNNIQQLEAALLEVEGEIEHLNQRENRASRAGSVDLYIAIENELNQLRNKAKYLSAKIAVLEER